MPSVDWFMMLLLLQSEADCLDQQHRRTATATSNDPGAGALTAVQSHDQKAHDKP
jgi:hypothetical protein